MTLYLGIDLTAAHETAQVEEVEEDEPLHNDVI